MSASVASTQVTAYTTGASLTITKPVSLAVGDLMIAFIQGAQESVTPPSGWTLIKSYVPGGGTTQMRVYGKIADSGDVAASNFTWTFGGGQHQGGMIARITEFNAALPFSVFAFDDETATATPTFTASVTPDTTNSLILFFLGTYLNSGTGITASGYAVATSNPSWSENGDQTVNGGSYTFQMSLASASRPQKTATGNASVTMNGSCTDLGCIMVVIRTTVGVTALETETVVDSLNKGVHKTILDTEAVVDTLESRKQKDWNNTAKNASPITNQDKH